MQSTQIGETPSPEQRRQRGTTHSFGQRLTKLIAPGVFGFSAIVFCFITVLGSSERGSDFDQFHAAATLVGTGRLYDWNSLKEVEISRGSAPLPFGRLPVYAAMFKPLTLLPYAVGRYTWFALNMAAAFGFAMIWPFSRRQHIIMVLYLSYPFFVLLSTGQDTAFFLLFVTLGLYLLKWDLDFLAGLTMALCASKPHLALPIPVFLIATRRWNAIWGGLCGGVVLVAVSAVLEGWDWPVHLYALSGLPEFSPAPYKMPNLNGLAYWLPWSGAVEAILAVLVLTATWFIARKYPLEISAPVLLASGLIVSHHAYMYDAILLVPTLLLVHRMVFPILLKGWSILLCIPYVYTQLLEPSTSALAQIAITGFPLALLLFLILRLHNEAPNVARCDREPLEAILHLLSNGWNRSDGL